MNFKTYLVLSLLLVFLCPTWAFGQHQIGDMCRIKGMEENTLRGVGLVFGLQGTGDPNLATTGRMVAEALASSGMEIPRDANGNPLTEVFKDNKNAALVFVTARIPPEGARQGTKLDVQVMAWDRTSSLEGGILYTTMLTGGPIVDSRPGVGNSAGRAATLPVFARAEGKIRIEGNNTTTGRVSGGAQLLQEFRNAYYEQQTDYVQTLDDYGKPITKEEVNRYLNLVLRPGHADFRTAAEIANTINSEINNLIAGRSRVAVDPEENTFAQALDAVNVRVRFPEAYLDSPVEFVRMIKEINVLTPNNNNKIVINSRAMVISIGEEVYFSPVAVTSGDFKVDVAPFKELTLEDNVGVGNGMMKLKRLVQALNDIQAPPQTIIDVIKNLEEGGHIYGQVIEL